VAVILAATRAGDPCRQRIGPAEVVPARPARASAPCGRASCRLAPAPTPNDSAAARPRATLHRLVFVDQPKLIPSRFASRMIRRTSSRAAEPYTGFPRSGGSSVRAFIRIGVGQPRTKTSGEPRPVSGSTRLISSVPSFAGYRSARDGPLPHQISCERPEWRVGEDRAHGDSQAGPSRRSGTRPHASRRPFPHIPILGDRRGWTSVGWRS